MHEKALLSRRRCLKLAGGAAAAVALLTTLPRRVMAGSPHLSITNDATAKALHYVEDNTKAVAPHQAGQDCANCMQYQGKQGETYGPCALFPGFDVHNKGWCQGYAVKS